MQLFHKLVHYLHLLRNHSQAMSRLLTLLALILNCSAKLFNSNAYDEENGLQPKSIESSVLAEFVNRGDPLWVLILSGDDWMTPKLRLGNTAELEEFFQYIEPSIINTRRRRPAVRVKKDDPERQSSTDHPVYRSIGDAKKNFITMINKFALSSSIEPDAYITDNSHLYDNSPSIALHFKGPYSILIVELGRKQWHYYIKSRSLLPEWFFEKHDTQDSPIIIPEDVKIQLYSSVWRLLHVFFGYPV